MSRLRLRRINAPQALLRSPRLRDPFMPTIEDTKALIARAHATQTDKAGKPYVEHLMRVYHRLKQKRASITDHLLSTEEWEHVLHAALVHHILEDTSPTADDLRALGYDE